MECVLRYKVTCFLYLSLVCPYWSCKLNANDGWRVNHPESSSLIFHGSHSFLKIKFQTNFPPFSRLCSMVSSPLVLRLNNYINQFQNLFPCLLQVVLIFIFYVTQMKYLISINQLLSVSVCTVDSHVCLEVTSLSGDCLEVPLLGSKEVSCGSWHHVKVSSQL